MKQHHSANGQLNSDKRIYWAQEIEGNNRPISNEIENEHNIKLSGSNEISIEIPEIELDDVYEEIEYWKNVVVCYILGPSPPKHVMEGFLQRIWGTKGIDRIAIMGNGVYMVRFCNQEDQERILGEDCHFFMAYHWLYNLGNQMWTGVKKMLRRYLFG